MPCNLLNQKVCGGTAINTYNTWMYERRSQKSKRHQNTKPEQS